MIMDIKMQRVIVILGVLLFPKALSALKCYECTDVNGSCNETQRDCPASQQCGAEVIRTYHCGIMTADVKIKGCMLSAMCDARASGSYDLGFTEELVSYKCCSTDLCNDQYPTIPDSSASSIPNGKKCYTCKRNDCSNILSCSGDEDRCVSISDEQVTKKGCSTKSLCGPPLTPGVSCCEGDLCNCEGDLCNSATSTAVGLLLLLAAPVVSVALFN